MIKHRNPLVVGALVYIPYILGYIGMQVVFAIISKTDAVTGELEVNWSAANIIALLIPVLIMIAGSIYGLYWLLKTANELRRTTGLPIPNGILLIIPFANYWWMWRYGQAAEKYTGGKLQGALAFIVIALLGGIGMAIVQDYYNKSIPEHVDTGAPQTPVNPQPSGPIL